MTFVYVRVPEGNLLGPSRSGCTNFLFILDEGRIAIVVLATRVAQGCVDESIKYADKLQLFGQLVGSCQAISFKIARIRVMCARCEIGRAHV